MEKKYKYKLDKKSRWITFIIFFLIAVVTACFYIWLPTRYIPTWFVVTIFCLIAIVTLSIPRFIKVNDEALEIHCIVELTRIHIEDIESVRPLKCREARWIIPLLASYGFFGYFGSFFSLRDWDFYKVYTAARVNRVVIEDIYEDRYLVSCRDADRLIETVTQAKLLHAGKS
jgi:hypothetical protein